MRTKSNEFVSVSVLFRLEHQEHFSDWSIRSSEFSRLAMFVGSNSLIEIVVSDANMCSRGDLATTTGDDSPPFERS